MGVGWGCASGHEHDQEQGELGVACGGWLVKVWVRREGGDLSERRSEVQDEG